jgi:hypothetical protein
MLRMEDDKARGDIVMARQTFTEIKVKEKKRRCAGVVT